MRWISYGPNAWLLQFAEQIGDEAFQRGRAIALELERHPPPGLIEYAPCFTTVLLEFEGVMDASALETLSHRLRKAMGARLSQPVVREIPVCYDGPDLGRVARHNGLGVEEVPLLHAATVYKVYTLGFAPGFPYLGDLDPRLHTPRLDSPRLRVPAGSVAIGGEHTGIYPIETPGGWNIIGHTTVRLFDPIQQPRPDAADGMFFLRPGDRVKFVAIDAAGERR